MPYSRLFYHFIWSTKDRLPLITAANRTRIFSSIVTKTVEMKGIVHAVNGTCDHLHVVATVAPSVSLALFVGEIKGISSYLASRLAEGYLEPFAWQGDYGVLSVSELHLPIVVRYVANQQRHHAEGSLNDKLERIA